MLRKLTTIIFVIFIVSCNQGIETNKQADKKASLETIKDKKDALGGILKSGKLKAVTDFGPTSYFIYHGQPMGYQYELLNRFAYYLGVELDLKLEKDLLKSKKELLSSKTDLIAMGLTVTNERKEMFDFSEPILFTRQVLVQRKPKGWRKMKTLDEIESHLIRNPIDLAGKDIYIKAGTIYKERLLEIQNSIADTINIIEDKRWTDKLIDAVAEGEIDFTVADEHNALVTARDYPNIDIKTTLSIPQKISWAVQKGQQPLLDTLNKWLKNYRKDIEFRLLYNKYFVNRRASKIANSTYNSYSGNQLSPYDDLIKKHSEIIGWDWRLIASLVYQESGFKPEVKSWVGAYGLMQLMPEVMEHFGIDSTASPEKQIIAGISHLKDIERMIKVVVTDSSEWVNFTLASYNSGIGHVMDARRLAKKYGKNPDVWEANVDEFILNLSDSEYYHDTLVKYGYMRGEETYNFVNEINYRYLQYKQLIKD